MLNAERAPLREGDVPGVNLPSLDHLNASSFANVYEPAEDTYLFVDTLHADADFLAQLKPNVCLEVGGGSGCVSAALAQVLRKIQVASCHMVTDINPHAVDACHATFEANGVMRGDVLRCDLLSSLRASLVDVLLFNPPYVPTPPEEVGGTGISAAWAGGDRGREVLDRLLPDLCRVIAPGGCLYLIAVQENDPEEIMATLTAMGFETQIRSKRRAQNERLMVIRATLTTRIPLATE